MIAIELKVERTRKGFTQEQMAKTLGVSTVSYSKKERGEVRFKPEEIMLVFSADPEGGRRFPLRSDQPRR